MVSTTESSGNLVQHRLLVPRLSLMMFLQFLSGVAGRSRSVW
jgi:hypothetical protein